MHVVLDPTFLNIVFVVIMAPVVCSGILMLILGSSNNARLRLMRPHHEISAMLARSQESRIGPSSDLLVLDISISIPTHLAKQSISKVSM